MTDLDPTDSALPQGRVENIPLSAWNAMRQQHTKFAAAFIVPIGLGVGITLLLRNFSPIILVPWLYLAYWYGVTLETIRRRFWEDVASSKGWSYQGYDDVSDEDALFLTEGHAREIRHQIVGAYKGVPLRVFESTYTLGYGKNKTVYTYTAFAFRFTGTFPHCYLNRKDNGYNMVPHNVPRVPLPAAFERDFTLYAPREYEVEALQIFTEDVLAYLLDGRWLFDIEFVDHEMIVFRKGYIDTRDTFEHELDQACRLAHQLERTLQTMTFSPVGDRPPVLRVASMNTISKTTQLFSNTLSSSRVDAPSSFLFVFALVIAVILFGVMNDILWLFYVAPSIGLAAWMFVVTRKGPR
jgi:hypothetical protein